MFFMMERLFSFLPAVDESPGGEESNDASAAENHQGHEIRDFIGARRKPVGLPQLSESTAEWDAWIWRETREEYWRGCWGDEIPAMWDSLSGTPKEGKEGDDPPTGYLGKKDGQDEGEEPDEPNKSISVDRFTLKLAGDELKTIEIPAKRWLTNVDSERPFTGWGSDEWKKEWEREAEESRKTPPTEPDEHPAKPNIVWKANRTEENEEQQIGMKMEIGRTETTGGMTPRTTDKDTALTTRIEELTIVPEERRIQVKPVVEELQIVPEVRTKTITSVIEELEVNPETVRKISTPTIEELKIEPDKKLIQVNPVVEELQVIPEKKKKTITAKVEELEVNPETVLKTITPMIEELQIVPEGRRIQVNPVVEELQVINYRKMGVLERL